MHFKTELVQEGTTMLNQPWLKLSCRLCLPVILAGALALFMFGFVGGVALAHDEPALAPGAPASQVFAANLSTRLCTKNYWNLLDCNTPLGVCPQN